MAFNLSNVVIDCLRTNTGKKLTAREVASWIFKTYPEECSRKIKSSKNKLKEQITNSEDMDSLLIAILIAEIGAQKNLIQNKSPQVKTTEGRPRKYYYSEQSDEEELEEPQPIKNTQGKYKENQIESIPLEHDLYPKLIEYLKTEQNLFSKRIDEKKSNNNRGPKGNEWLYPDLVALEDLSFYWSSHVTKCSRSYGDKKAKLWSFEVKRIINTSNVRSTLFQCVSNSSWANFGYLVAAQLAENAQKELRMLASLHGIGFILLNIENPSESQIIIPAREKADLDWESINRLCEANTDFSDYIEEINDFCVTGKTKNNDWD